MRIVLTLTVAAALALAACSDDGGETFEPATTTVPSEELSAEEAEAVIAFRPVLADPRPATECRPDEDAGLGDGEPTCFELGPIAVDARAVESASAGLGPSGEGWQVNPVFRVGDPGIEQFNAIAAHCHARDPTCPTGLLAILADGEVLSAPTIQQARFERDRIQITGDFTQEEAEALAESLSP
jgi:preprotein translocase subunit SecD